MICFRWGVTHLTKTPYYPQPSLAERVNCNLKAALKIFHHQSQATWDEDLPCLSVAFNTAVHEITKATPDKLFLGRELKCPLLVRWALSPVSECGSGETSQSFWTQAYANIMQARDKLARRYIPERKPHSFRKGDTVVYRMNVASSKVRGISAKLLQRWSKPAIIAKIVRPNVVLLANPETGVIIRRAHVTQLKPYVK